MKSSPKKNIWVIQTSFIGDLVLTLPFFHELAELTDLDQTQITVFVRQGPCEDLLNLALQRGLAAFKNRITVLGLDKKKEQKSIFGMHRLVQRLAAEGNVPERVYCLQRSFRTGLLAMLSGAPERIGFSSGGASFFYTQSVARAWESGRSEIEKNLDLLRASFADTKIIWDPKTAPSLLGEAAVTSEPIVALSPGSPWPTKRWPVEQAAPFVKAMIQNGNEVHILGDASSTELGVAIENSYPSPMLKNFSGKTSVREWVDKIASVTVLVSGDSAAVHVASDLGVPVVALFGPTVPEFGFAPWRRGSVVLGLNQLACRPCDIHGPKACPLGHHDCLKRLDADTVAHHCQKLINAAISKT